MRTMSLHVQKLVKGLVAGMAIAAFPALARDAHLPTGAAAYRIIPVHVAGVDENAVASGDRLTIRVFEEAELTSDQYIVDDEGKLQVPLIGDVDAAGHSLAQLRDEIVRRLGARYIRNPQVTVAIAERHHGLVTVEGQVRDPGRFPATPDLTLLGAVALAHSTSQNARMGEVIVLRDVGDKHLAARFDLNDVRRGITPDPQILGGDKVVVGYSAARGLWHDFLQATPLFNIFYLVK